MSKRSKLTQCTDSAAHGISSKKATEIRKATRHRCRCGHQWSQHIGGHGDGFAICAGRDCRCAYREVRVAVKKVYGVRKEALAARRQDKKRDAFYLNMAVENELEKRKQKSRGFYGL